MSAKALCNSLQPSKTFFFTDDTKRNGKIYLYVTHSTEKCVKWSNLPKNIFRHRTHGEQSRQCRFQIRKKKNILKLSH